MKTVWVICQTVDLGYHMIKGYHSHDKAKAEFDRMRAEAITRQVAVLMKHGSYTKEQAEKWCESHSFYELESVEIEE
jgi:hypothetical protein